MTAHSAIEIAPRPDPIPSSAPARWPLSPAQRVVWLDMCVRADPLAYQLSGRARLHGRLDPALLAQAVHQAMVHHDALRLRIDARRPEQWLAPADGPVPLQCHELPRHESADARDTVAADLDETTTEALAALAARIHAEPLPLDGRPLFAIDAIRLGPARWDLLWRCSHLIADGLSVWLKVKHIAQAYNELLAGQQPPLSTPTGTSFLATLTPADATAASPRAETDRAHWLARLSDLPPPVFEPRPAAATDSPLPVCWSLEAAAYRAWQAACAQVGVSEQRALLALLALAVGTRQNRDDLIVGMALHGRSRATREVVGMFSTVLPVRCDWNSQRDSLADVVQRVSTLLERDYRRQRLPVDDIGRLIGLSARGRGRLFDISLSYLPADAQAVTVNFGDGVAYIEREIPSTIVPLPLDVMDHAEDQRLTFSLGHDPAHLSHADAVAMAHCLQRTLQAFCDDSAQPASGLSPLSLAEQQRVLHDFQPPLGAAPSAQMLHDLVREQVRRTPQAVAIEDDQRRISYAQLDLLSDQLAARLSAVLPPPPAEPVVAVALPRSAETVVALLAILKAQAVYLPLDTALPAQRLQYMLDDAQTCVLIDALDLDPLGAAGGDACRSPGLPQIQHIQRLPDAANAGPSGAAPSSTPDDCGEASQRLAYIIYTSGSTGEPKPVGVSHRAAVNLAFARQGHDPLGPGDKVLAAISVGFDVSIGQLLLPLLSGATIVIAPPLQQLQADAFWDLLARHQVSHINSVPSFFETVSEAQAARPADQRYTGLRRLMLGGESLTGPLVTKLRQRLPGTQVVNMYGPTETCIDATAYVVPDGPLPAALPIGRALPNYRAYVLDSLDRLAAPGVTGELCIAGAGVARGYLGRPELTAEKFGDDRFADPGLPPCDRRWYRTGDLARWREDGQLEFLGRNDQQVKIRGHRIETGEIEATLLQLAQVRQAAVIALPDARGALQLVAYLVAPLLSVPAPADTTEASRAVLDELAGGLPEHMLPAKLVWLPALPLTPNGKLDRKALPVPELTSSRTRHHTPPQGELEKHLARLWQAVLAVEQVGREDNFFDLGGHSLLALAMMEQLRQSGWRASVPALFADPTVRGLAAACRPVEEQPHDSAPPASIPPGAGHITPDMLPMVALSPAQIDQVTAQVPGGAAGVQDIYPLAPLQQGMLYHHLMQTEGDVFISPFVVAFAQRAAMDAFLLALNQVMARHDILRTSLAWDGLPEPVQVVWRHAELPVQDLGQMAASQALSTLQARVDPRHHRMDLRRAPLLRAVTVQEGPGGRHLLALVLHHLALDHTSMEVTLQEVAAILSGQAATLPEPVPFRTLVWQTRQAVADDTHSAYFRQQLADLDRPTTPYGLDTLPGEGDSVAEHVQALPAELTLALRAQARAAGVSLASLMHLAYALVLARTSGSDDVVMGTVLLGRLGGADGPASGRALGMLINTLPLRVRLDAAPSVADALRATQAGLSNLMRHEHAPLALAQRCSGVAAPTPLFTALFNFRHSLPLDAGANAVLGMELVSVRERTGYPVALAVDDTGSALTLTAQTMAPVDPAHLNALMTQALQCLTGPLDLACTALNVMPEPERQRLLRDMQPPRRAVPATLLHEQVRTQVLRTPTAAAVVDGEQRITYAELDALSDALAQQLRAALGGLAGGVDQPVVAVALPRSADTVVALLAILKAGAVYLPLDIAYPPQRLQYMLDDAQAALLLDLPGQTATQGLRATRLPPQPADLASPLAAVPAALQPGSAAASQLAYIIYTSGSTGQPKGVAVSHGAAANLAHARQDHDPIGPGDHVLAAISVGFDVSIGQLLLPLLSGATVVIAPPLQQMAPSAFWALLARHGVTHINSVPSFFDAVSEALMAQPEAERYRGLKRLMLGGEVLTAAMARKLQQRLPGTQLVNMYGPTEACIDATAYPVPADGELPAALPIGRPLPNYRAHVVDAHGRLAPVGVAGELCLAGAGLARGYIGLPQATAEKFVPNPFGTSADADARMYRTGDRARWRQDGLLEFLGRDDEQVKIRGFRVETGEVEAALLADARVRQAAVLACKDSAGGPILAYLAAYLVAAGAERPDDATLRRQLGAQLPEHMVPQAYVWLDALPITPNGKLDRKALPAPRQRVVVDTAVVHVAPRNDLEARLLVQWQQVFPDQAVGVTDNFFELGGHSLLAMRLLTACQTALRQPGVPPALALSASRLSLRQLLTSPTIEAMARQLAGDGASAGNPQCPLPLVPLRPAGSRPPLFCVHPQAGTVMCFADLARRLPQDLPVYGLQAVGLEAGETPLDQIAAIAAHYNTALQQHWPAGPVQLLGYSAGGVIAQEMAHQLRAAGRSVSLLVLLDSPVPQSEALRQAPSEAGLLQHMARWMGAGPQEAVPQDAGELAAWLRARGLAAEELDDSDLQRMLATAHALARGLAAHVAQPLALDLLLARALQRSDPLPDWQPLLQPPAKLHALDLDTTHDQLLGSDHSPAIAAWLAGRLAR